MTAKKKVTTMGGKNVSADQKRRIHIAAINLSNKTNGFHLLPIMPNSKKLPPADTGVNYGSACRTSATAEKWFGEGCEFEGWNLAISCGGHSKKCVLDLDIGDETKEDGFETLARWAEEAGEMLDFATTTVRTPSGGIHYYFQYDPRLINKKGVGKKAIDFQSGSQSKDSSHVVCPPSMVQGRMYEYIVPPEEYGVTKMPEWLVQRLIKEGAGAMPSSNANRKLGVGGNRGNENVQVEDLEQIPDAKQVRGMLKHIDPNTMEYDDWFRMLPTLHHIFSLLGDLATGLEIADEWSQRGSRYKAGEVHTRWNKLNEPTYRAGERGRCTSATLFWLAKEGGWKPTEEDKVGGLMVSMLEEINRRFPLAKVGNKLRMVELDSEGCLHPYTVSDVALLYDNKKVMVASGNKTQAVNPVNVWKGWEGRLTYEGIGLYPPPMKVPDGHLNFWSGFAVEPQSGDVQPFLDFVLEVICDGNRENAEWVLDWVADLVQHVGDKKGTALVFRGDEGCGKGTFTLTVASLFKPAQFCHFIDSDQFINQFNAHLMQSVLVLSDEAVWSGNHKAAGKLKGIITEKFIMIQPKGVDTFSAPNSARVVIHTNEEWSVPAGMNSRRFMALHVSNRRVSDEVYWKDLHEWVKANRSQLLHYFQNRKIKNNIRKALVTGELVEQRRLTAERDMTLADEVVFYLLKNGSATKLSVGDHAGQWVWFNKDVSEIGFLLNDNKKVSSQLPVAVRKVLEKQGLKLKVGRMKLHGEPLKFTLLPPSPAVLIEAMQRKFSLTEEDTEWATDWKDPAVPAIQRAKEEVSGADE